MTSPALLPDVRTEDDYTPLRRDPTVWLPALRELCARHALDPERFERAADGTHVVFLGPDVVLKLFVRIWPEDHARELAALAALAGSELPVPRLLATGELDGWPYLLQERLGGTAVKHVWSTLSLDDQRDLLEQTGALLARLHAVPVEGCTPPLATDDWRAFLAERLERCVEHHARGGASPSLVDEVRALLAPAPDLLEPDLRPRLIHADLTHDHLLVAQAATGRWRVVGLIDWADAMLGHPLYDLVTPAAFLAQGRAGLGQALLRGYGLAAPDPDLERRLLLHLLLHKYGHLAGVLRHAHGEPARDLPGLQRSLWGPGA